MLLIIVYLIGAYVVLSILWHIAAMLIELVMTLLHELLRFALTLALFAALASGVIYLF